MKVLFAVSNDSISNSIVKKYQKEYKEIISYKNVYYFNAILKELQKDKTYERVVISEDLEQFTNSDYEQMDKFIFDKLDAISDEATNTSGTSILLICSERRTPGEPILNKLFSIGIFNAIMGNDRSTDEVCRLLNKPRTKKEAKDYYRLDTDDLSYQPENENDVSEEEVQNILAHYKRLGKNEERYVESFNNIASQYNDVQLRLISKYLPLNVRAVLEEKSPKYQQIMSFNSSVSDEIRYGARKGQKEELEGTSERLLSNDKNIKLSGPVVVPQNIKKEGVKTFTSTAKINLEGQNKKADTGMNRFEPVLNNSSNMQFSNINSANNIVEPEVQIAQEPEKRRRGRPRKIVPEEEKKLEQVQEEPVKRKRGRPRKNPIEDDTSSMLPGFGEDDSSSMLPGFDEDNTSSMLPGFDEDSTSSMLPGFGENNGSSMIPGFDDDDTNSMLPGFGDDNSSSIASSYGKENNNSSIASGYRKENNNNSMISSYGNDDNNSSMLPGFENDDNNVATSRFGGYSNSYDNVNDTINIDSLLSNGKKLVTFVGTSKNGTSFIVNNVAEKLSSMGINTAIFDATQNKNSYYIYTKNERELRNIAETCVLDLKNGNANGIRVNRNLTVYTSIPSDEESTLTPESAILETLVRNHTVVLVDCDFNTPLGYFKNSQEMYLVQSMDILTIQPLTAFLDELKAKNVLDESKIRIVLNKYVRLKGISEKIIIGAMACYNNPEMSIMVELFNRNAVKYITIPFDNDTYVKYLEGIVECDVSLRGYSKQFKQILDSLTNMIYPTYGGKGKYVPNSSSYQSAFSPNMNDTLNKMKQQKRY
jgi:hypothetical protein